MNVEPFLKPKLIGARFDGGVLPLHVLADFAVLEQMIVDIAKWKFRLENPTRKRVPRGFTDGISLKLTGVEEGSAIPLISLFFAATTLFPPAAKLYFEDARAAIRLTLRLTSRMTESQAQEAERAMLTWLERYCRRGATPHKRKPRPR